MWLGAVRCNYNIFSELASSIVFLVLIIFTNIIYTSVVTLREEARERRRPTLREQLEEHDP